MFWNNFISSLSSLLTNTILGSKLKASIIILDLRRIYILDAIRMLKRKSVTKQRSVSPLTNW
jgi:hypothetical protein